MKVKLLVARHQRGRGPARLHPRPHEDPQHADRRQVHDGRVRRGQGRAGRPDAARPTPTGRPPHFVWQVREALSAIVCPDTPTDCPGWTPAATASRRPSTGRCSRRSRSGSSPRRAPRTAKSPRTVLRSRKIPAGEWDWILGLRGHNIHNAAAAVIDYRTGEVLAYAGSAGYTAKGNKKFQPQFDVLSDGFRQPGSAIKPINYLIGIDDEHADRVDDVHGRLHQLRQQLHAGPGRQARARAGPAALRAAVLPQRPGHQGRRSSPASTTSSTGPRTSGSTTRRTGRAGHLDGHRHAGGPPDRPAGRLRHGRQRRPADAPPA